MTKDSKTTNSIGNEIVNQQAPFVDEILYLKQIKRPTERPQVIINSADQARNLFIKEIGDNANEESLVYFLDIKNRVIAQYAEQGEVSYAKISIRNIIQHALLINAHAIIMGHNHPSGEITPSTYDFKTYEHVRIACDLFDINVVDQFVCNDEDAYSFKENDIY